MVENTGTLETPIVEPKEKMSLAKFLGWNARGISIAANTIVITYLTIYATDTVQLPPALVGTLLFSSKILDIFVDVFLGLLIDKSPETRFGKARPYEFAVIGVWLGTIMMFSIPTSLGIVGKSIWLFTTYTFVSTIFTSLLAANATTYTFRAFRTRDAITKLGAYGGIVVTLGAMAVSISFPMLMATFATTARGWTTLITIYAIPMIIIGMMRFFFVKETVKVESANSTEQVNLRAVFNTIKKNKYVWLFGLIILPVQTVQAMNVAPYYFTYIVGNIGVYGTLQIVGIFGLIVMVLFPKLIRRFSVTQVITLGVSIGILGFALNFFAKDNVTLLAIASLLTAMASLPVVYLQALLLFNLSAYNEVLGLPRLEGTMSSIGGLFTNIGMGLGAAITGVLLSLSGYDGSLDVQSDSALLTIRVLYSAMPILIYFITIVAARKFSHLEKQMNELDMQK